MSKEDDGIDDVAGDVEQVEAPAPAESLRDTIAKAYDSHAEPGETADNVKVDEKPARARAQDGKFTKAEAAEASKPEAKGLEQRKTVAPAATRQAITPGPAELKPPQSWKSTAREKWNTLAPEVREEVLRIERETKQAIAAHAAEKKYAQSFREVVTPYEAQIRAEGSTPERAVQNLLQTALALRTAPPAHKAELMAETLITYGVPLEHLVASLERRLSGQPAPRQPQGQQFQPQSLDPASIAKQVREELMSSLEKQRESQAIERGLSEVEVFGADKEFFDDLREDMADIIDRANNRGSPITLEQAYNRAAREHPEASKVFEQREAASRAAKANASTQRSRNAASSVRSSPAVNPGSVGRELSRREVIEKAWDDLASR